jgi:hypothetical protein
MNTALTYLATSLTLGILLIFARRQHHGIHHDSEVYRYPSLYLNVIALGTPIYGVFAAIIYTRNPEIPRSAGFITALTIVFGTFMLGISVAYFYFRSFSIDITDSRIIASSWGRRRTILWDSIASIRLVTGRQGLGEMRLFNQSNKLLLRVGSSIQDYEDLVWSVKVNTRRSGVVIHERDRNGIWSESANR